MCGRRLWSDRWPSGAECRHNRGECLACSAGRGWHNFSAGLDTQVEIASREGRRWEPFDRDLRRARESNF